MKPIDALSSQVRTLFDAYEQALPDPITQKEEDPMKKVAAGAIIAALILGAGFILGIRYEKKRSTAAVDIINQSNHAIMTLSIRHQNGTVIAANIKKNRRERVTFHTKGANSYSLTVTLDNNKTLYSDRDRTIRHGEVVREIVGDSTIVTESRE